MWTCTKCGEETEEHFDSCWKCFAPRGVVASTPAAPETESAKWRLEYRVFRGTFTSREELFTQAAVFANELGPERVVSTSHSEDKNDGVVAVWYWTNDNAA
jgi:hypothetical protein